MKRLKQMGICFVAMALVWGCMGCGGKAEKELDAVQTAAQLVQGLQWQDTLTQLDEQAIALLYNISTGDIKSQCVYASTGATAEEVAVFCASDDKAASRIEQAVRARIEELRSGFERYVPQEMNKLANPILCVRANNVILCISNDNQAAQQQIDALLQ